MGKQLASQSFISWLGQEKYQRLARWILKYIASIEGIPKMTGTFIEFRNGMINVSPVGRAASKDERDEYEAWDKKTNTRAKMIEALKKEFPDYGLTYVVPPRAHGPD
jgi:phosphomannomutase